MEQNLAYFAAHKDEVDVRLHELDREPTIEALLTGGACTATLGGLFLGLFRGRLWLLLPAAAQVLALEHLRRGSCAPARFLRALGVRSRDEVEEERFALKVVRGDFESVPESAGEETFTAARRLGEAVQH